MSARVIRTIALAFVLLTSACIGPSPTDPGGAKAPTPTLPGDPPDEVVKR